MSADLYLGLGTNLGDRRAHLAGAVDALFAEFGSCDLSSVYQTEPVGHREQPVFWNLAVKIAADAPPRRILEITKDIETRLGRERTSRESPRVIDVDILLYGRREMKSESLEIPHPRLLERAFVLRPLLELTPDLRHPVIGDSLADVLAQGDFESTMRLFPGSELRQNVGDTGAEHTSDHRVTGA